MKINTEISRADLIRFNAQLLPRVRATYISIGVLALIIFSILLIQNGLPNNQRTWVIYISGSFIGGIAGVIAGSIFSSVFILFASTKSNGTLGHHEYSIDEIGLFEKTQANEGYSKWEGIHDIKETGSFLLFRISAYLYHIIPKRSFSSEAECKQFKNKSIVAWSKAHNKKFNVDTGADAPPPVN